MDRKLYNNPYVPLNVTLLKSVPVLEPRKQQPPTDFRLRGLQSNGAIENEWMEKIEVLQLENEELKAQVCRNRTEIEHLRTENQSLRRACESQCRIGSPQNIKFPENSLSDHSLSNSSVNGRGISSTRKLINSLNNDLEEVILSYLAEHPSLINEISEPEQAEKENENNLMENLMSKLKYKR